MADVTMTATAVKKADNNAKVETAYSAEAIAIGDAVYMNTSSKWAKADADLAATDEVRGLALNSVSGADQPVTVITEGNLTCDGLTKGTPYFLSTGAGKICPIADLLAGDYVTFIGIATSTTNLLIKPLVSSITV